MGHRRSDPFAGLRHVGPATRADLERLGIRTRTQLARASADRLYAELERLTRSRQDPCVWDVFAAAIHQARGGAPLDWWQFTPLRKQRQAAGTFPPHRPPQRVARRA